MSDSVSVSDSVINSDSVRISQDIGMAVIVL